MNGGFAEKRRKSRKEQTMKRAIIAVLACALAIAFVACALTGGALRTGRGWESSTIVRLEAPRSLIVGNLSLGYMRWLTTPAEGSSGALPVRDGDLLYVKMQGAGAEKEGEFILPWRAEDGAKLSFKMDGPRLLLGERVVSLKLDGDAAGWDWAGKAPERELASLRFVTVDKPPADEPLSDERVHVFERIAGVNPHVGLALDDGALLERVSSLDPRWLMIDKDKMTQAELEAVVNRRAIETLFLGVKDAGFNLQGLATLPNLRRLILSNFDSTKTAMPVLPRLDSLTFVGGTLQDLTAIKPLTGLRELNLNLSETISLNGIQALPQLQELGISGAKDEKTLDFAPLDGLEQLRWVSFGQGITEAQFARVIQTHPGLRVVELLKCEDVRNLAPLGNLRDLKALIFLPKEYEGSLEPLKQMKNLRLLVLSEEIFKKEPTDVAELGGALPDCVIAEGEPFCLGAGRIFLLVPLAALGWMVAARRRSRAACRAPYAVHS